MTQFVNVLELTDYAEVVNIIESSILRVKVFPVLLTNQDVLRRQNASDVVVRVLANQSHVKRVSCQNVPYFF